MTTYLVNSPSWHIESVEDLVNAARKGDSSAFGELVRRFESAVHALAMRRLGNPLEAEELAQEVFIRALEKIGQLQTSAAFGGWLRTITNRLAINRLVRRSPSVAAAPEVLEASCVDHRSPLEDVLARERREQVQAGLARLREMDRDTLVAFYVEGQSLTDMSRDFESPIGTIKRRLHVARKRLAKELEAVAG
ncbi:MAG: sigma-70 family RNA polymerase sigma factor [Pirellulales bacterium]|nr:sigma-70 family RNA polymerase sigma factor [Pirellulales bacterium]